MPPPVPPAAAGAARNQLEATILKSGLLKTNAGVPRPAPSLFYFPGPISRPVHDAGRFHWAKMYVWVWMGSAWGLGWAGGRVESLSHIHPITQPGGGACCHQERVPAPPGPAGGLGLQAGGRGAHASPR